jgi:hypothetical protein
MFDTKVIVAPNSPRLAAKAMTAPERMPGSISGRVMVRKRSIGPAPSVRAAASRPLSIASIASRIARTISGNDMTPAATEAPVDVKISRMPKFSSSHDPIGPRVPSVISSR